MHTAIIPRKSQTSADYCIGDLYARDLVKGDVGLEIETEGKNLLRPEETPEPWVYTTDGSLRGEENAEYVLGAPIAFDKVDEALSSLWEAFNKKKARLDDSNRTSIHVHLNVQGFYLNRLTSLLALYFSVEEILTEWCGEFRVGNLFCLRGKDAPAILDRFREYVVNRGQISLSESLRYGGANLHSLYKFGSLEIRLMRGVADKETALFWVKVLERLYKFSADFEDPREVCGLFSQGGPDFYFDTVLGEYADRIRAECGFDSARFSDSLYEGIRMAQDICYCRDWSTFKKEIKVKDPFGRKPSKALQSGFQPNMIGTSWVISQTTANNPPMPMMELSTDEFDAMFSETQPDTESGELPEWFDDDE